METPSSRIFPADLNAFLTTEHFTLQSARGLINGEIVSRVNIYFTTLSSVLIAAAFLAQISALAPVFGLFVGIAFPVAVILGVFTMARLMVLGHTDFVYIRAINRVRQFYVQAAPAAQQFMLFAPHDDDRSVRAYGGYAMGFRGNLLSAAHMVAVTNSIVATVVLSALVSQILGWTLSTFWPFGLGILVAVYLLQGWLGFNLARGDMRPEYAEVRFPAPAAGPGAEKQTPARPPH